MVDGAFVTALLFTLSVWLIVQMTVHNLRSSLLTLGSLLLWLVVVTFLGKSGFLAINPLLATNIILLFLLLFIVLQKVYSAPRIRTVLDRLPVHWLIATQTYRVVGVSFLTLYQQGVLPAAFAFPSGYGDILVGVTAPFVAWALVKKKAKKIAIIWNIIGILDLVIALGVGILGYPRPWQTLPLVPSTEALSLYPLVLISCFAVPLALFLHAVCLRNLRK